MHLSINILFLIMIFIDLGNAACHRRGAGLDGCRCLGGRASLAAATLGLGFGRQLGLGCHGLFLGRRGFRLLVGLHGLRCHVSAGPVYGTRHDDGRDLRPRLGRGLRVPLAPRGSGEYRRFGELVGPAYSGGSYGGTRSRCPGRAGRRFGRGDHN